MQDAVHTGRLIRFGIFEADLESGELRKNGRKLRLTGQPFQVLAILLEQPNRVVSREELQSRLWPDTVVEVEHSLNAAINKIREALGDSAENPRFVETLPRRGYRFIAPILVAPEDIATDPSPPVDAHAATVPCDGEYGDSLRAGAGIIKPRKRILWTTAGIALLSGLAVAYWILRAPLPPPRITDYAQLTNDGRARNIGGTDGRKLFVNAFAPEEIAQVSTSDGQAAPLRINVPDAKSCASTAPTIRDVSPDGAWLIVLCAVQLNENQIWIVGALGHPARLLVTAQDAAWSKDGRSVAYSTVDGAIYRMPSEGGEARLLSPPVVPKGRYVVVSDLSWSPSGEVIRFTWLRAIWEVSARGGTPHRLLPPDRWPLPHCCGRWTPDGDFFIYLYGDTTFTGCVIQCGAQLWALDGRHDLLRRPIAKPIPLLSGPIRWADPTPSPDGQHLFARGITVRGELARYDAQAKQFKPYLGSISAQELAFSRDGKYVAYVTFPDGALWRANRDGSNIVLLRPASREHAAGPTWSPDGSEIVYLGPTGSGQNAVFSVPSTGGSAKAILSEHDGFYSDPGWSPDGTKMVFATVPLSEDLVLDLEKVRIRILDLKTKEISDLPHSESMYSPRWSPDGRYIAGLTIERQELRIYDVRTQRWRTVVKSGASYPAWSRDSHFLYTLQAGEVNGVYRFPAAGGPAELVVDLKDVRQTGWWGQWFGLDPDDEVLLLRDAGSYEVYSLSLERP